MHGFLVGKRGISMVGNAGKRDPKITFSLGVPFIEIQKEICESDVCGTCEERIFISYTKMNVSDGIRVRVCQA